MSTPTPVNTPLAAKPSAGGGASCPKDCDTTVQSSRTSRPVFVSWRNPTTLECPSRAQTSSNCLPMRGQHLASRSESFAWEKLFMRSSFSMRVRPGCSTDTVNGRRSSNLQRPWHSAVHGRAETGRMLGRRDEPHLTARVQGIWNLGRPDHRSSTSSSAESHGDACEPNLLPPAHPRRGDLRQRQEREDLGPATRLDLHCRHATASLARTELLVPVANASRYSN